MSFQPTAQNFTFILSSGHTRFSSAHKVLTYFRRRNTPMKLTLLFILLFSAFGGYGTSSVHKTDGAKVFQHASQQHQPLISAATYTSKIRAYNYSDTGEEEFTINDIEDDEDRDNLFLKKINFQKNTAFFTTPVISLSRFHSCSTPVVPVRSILQGKYITLRTLRV